MIKQGIIKAKTIRAYEKIKRINKIPELSLGLVFTILKRDSCLLIKNFKEGIKRNAFHLERLKSGTIQRKRTLGYTDPNIPLYGAGDEIKDKSYINMLRMRKISNGYRVRPSIAKHHTADLTLRHLYNIHEYGKMIKHSSGKMFRIPARPALTRAFEKTLKDISKDDSSQMVKRALTDFINLGKQTTINRVTNQLMSDVKQYATGAASKGD